MMNKFLDNKEKAYKSITRSLESLVQRTKILEDQVLQLMKVFAVYSAKTCNSMMTWQGTYYADPPWLKDVNHPHPNQPDATPSQPAASEDSIRPQELVEPEPHMTSTDQQSTSQEPP